METFKSALFFLLLFLFTLNVKSQNSFKKDSSNVHNVIIALFDGMRDGDKTKVNATFYEKVRMYTTFKSKEGEQKLEEGKLSHLLNVDASP